MNIEEKWVFVRIFFWVLLFWKRMWVKNEKKNLYRYGKYYDCNFWKSIYLGVIFFYLDGYLVE